MIKNFKTELSISIFYLMFNQTLYADTINTAQDKDLQVNNTARTDSLTFEASSLFGQSNKDIDLSAYNVPNRIAPGTYLLNLQVNDVNIGQVNIQFAHLDAKQTAVMCIDRSLLQKLDLKENTLEHLEKKSCLTIENISPDAYYDYDAGNLAIKISIPLALTNNRPRGYISPERYDKGTTAAYVGYSFNHYSDRYDEANNITADYLSLTGGINVGRFNFRHQGYFETNSNNKLSDYVSSLNVLSTDITPWEARLSVGDFPTSSYYLSSIPIRGIELKNDTAMRPWSQQSYAPLIRGFANTNALVSIYQNGQKIYEKTVPAGAFEINDLTTVNNNNDLTVEVTERGGEKHSSVVPMQTNGNLIRIGQMNYQVSAGRYKLNRTVLDENVLQATGEYGLFNNFTVHAGTNITSNYQSYLAGFGLSSRFGGLTADVEQANTNINNSHLQGQRYNLSYSYNFAPLNLSITANLRHTSQHYMGLSSLMGMQNYNELTQSEIENFLFLYQLKNQATLMLSQQLPKNWGSFYFSGSRSEYWLSSLAYNQFNLGYSNHWKQFSYSLNATQSASVYANKDRSISLSFSFPLSWRKTTTSVNNNINVNNNITHSNAMDIFNTGFSGTFGSQNQVSYGLNANRYQYDNAETNNSISSSINFALPQTNLGLVSSYSDTQSQWGANLSGAIVAHRYGITLTNNISDTYAIVHANDGASAVLPNAWGSKLDYFGNAIYANMDPYRVNTINIDTQKTALDVSLDENQTEVVPRRYSATMIDFKTKRTSNILLNVHTANDATLPMGIQATDKNGQVVAMMGQSNQLFIQTPDALKQPITLQWGANNAQQCTIPATVVNNKVKNTAFNIIDVECK